MKDLMKPSQLRNYPLTKQQIETLKITYKFRFITAVLLANYRNLRSDHSARLNLETLVQNQYLLKQYDKSYRLAGKGATYSLASKALKYLRTEHQLNATALHAMHKNKTASQSSINEHVELMAIFLALRLHYPETFAQFARVQLSHEAYFPQPRPDLYIRRDRPKQSKTNEYFVYNLRDDLLFQNRKRLKYLLQHFERDGWDGDYPTVLLVCNTQSIANRVGDYLVELELDEEFHCLLTTRNELLSGDPKVWTAYNTDQQMRDLDQNISG
jgi:hypothetical protein